MRRMADQGGPNLPHRNEIRMFTGPLFSREALILPRQLRHYLIRSGYVAALFVLMYTVGQATFGWQQVRNVGDFARFGSLVFQVLSLIQLTLVLFFALLFAAGNVAQEKDGQTLILLLMTDMRDRELVLGKLCASLLLVAVLLAASVPVFVFIHLLGGVALDQIVWSQAICVAAALAAGSWGIFVALWREKTFQTLAVSVLGLVLFLGAVEALVAVVGVGSPVGYSAALLNPYRALWALLNPLEARSGSAAGTVSAAFSAFALLVSSALLVAVAIWRLRIWNPTRTVAAASKAAKDGESESSRARRTTRRIWSNPVIWREICTRAYGRRVFAIKLAYCVIAALAIWYLSTSAHADGLVLGMVSPIGFTFVGLALLSLIMVNAQAVTSLTTERDTKTLELLLVTDITAKEFVYGKLGGVFSNMKELILIPMFLMGFLMWRGAISGEDFAYLMIGFLGLVAFAAMLGVHAGLSFDSSRASIANSLGTMFFLFVGVFIFMMLLVEARSSFYLQVQSFLVFILVGSLALYASLTNKNPSSALTLSALTLPFLTFYAITEFLLSGTLGVCLTVSVAYGFTTLAMLIPALSEFDVALGRTTLDKG